MFLLFEKNIITYDIMQVYGLYCGVWSACTSILYCRNYIFIYLYNTDDFVARGQWQARQQRRQNGICAVVLCSLYKLNVYWYLKTIGRGTIHAQRIYIILMCACSELDYVMYCLCLCLSVGVCVRVSPLYASRQSLCPRCFIYTRFFYLLAVFSLSWCAQMSLIL